MILILIPILSIFVVIRSHLQSKRSSNLLHSRHLTLLDAHHNAQGAGDIAPLQFLGSQALALAAPPLIAAILPRRAAHQIGLRARTAARLAALAFALNVRALGAHRVSGELLCNSQPPVSPRFDSAPTG